MSQLVDAELRLVDVIREAREFMTHLSEMQVALRKEFEKLPKAVRAQHPDVQDAINKAVEMLRKLKDETHLANEVAWKIEGHIKWKNTVLAVFGEEGVRRCFAHMQAEKKEAEAESV